MKVPQQVAARDGRDDARVDGGPPPATLAVDAHPGRTARAARVLTLLLGAVLLALLPAGGTPAGAAGAAQHRDANLAIRWDFRGQTGFWNIDQQVLVSRKARNSYWAMQWSFTAAPSAPGYMGLQTNGLRFDGSSGDTAIFSLWDANGRRGPSCGSFTGEGDGLSCRRGYSIRTDTWYRYRTWRLEADSQGQWWGAWIMNLRTGTETWLGDLRVPRDRDLATPPLNFSEYWGSAVGCDSVPRSTVYFTQPAANQQSPGRYAHGSSFAGSSRGACTGGSARDVAVGSTRAAMTTLGGRR